MNDVEQKLVRELGFRVNEQGHIENNDNGFFFQESNHAQRLWHKCSELSETVARLTGERDAPKPVSDMAYSPEYFIAPNPCQICMKTNDCFAARRSRRGM
jgi:hypothetical protein